MTDPSAEHDPLQDEEQDLLLVLPLSDREMGNEAERDAIEAFAEQLETAVLEAAAGEYDGNEVGGGEYILFFCGPDIDRLIAVLRPLLQQSVLGRGASFELMSDGPDGELERHRIHV